MSQHKHFTLFSYDANFDFVGRRHLYFALTALGILASLIALATIGFNKGIDFKGGTKLVMEFDQAAKLDRHDLQNTVTDVLQKATGKTDVGQVEVQDFSTGGGRSNDHFSVMTELTTMVTNERRDQLTAKLREKFPGAEVSWAAEGEDRAFLTLKDPAKVNETYAGLREVFAAAGYAKVGTGSDAESQLDVNLFRSLQMLQSEGKAEAQVKSEEQALRDAKAKELGERSDQRFTVVVEEFKGKLETGVATKYGKAFLGVVSSTAVSPSVAGDMLSQGMVSIIYAILGIVLYIILRFDLRYAPGALLALVHDVTLVIGCFSFAQVKFSMPVIAAVMTVAGYSISDTIVVFDRIRETQERHPDVDIETVVNASVNATMSRTVLTAATTLMTAGAIFLFGGGLIRDFAFAMVLGVIIGTFSSIFVASPMFIWLHHRFEGRKSELVKGDAAGAAAPAA